MTHVTRGRRPAKGDAARPHEKYGPPPIPTPRGFDAVVAEDKRQFREHPRHICMIRPAPPAELEAERGTGVRRSPLPGHAPFTLVRQRGEYVWERQIVSLPIDWRHFDRDYARALWERTTAVRYVSDEHHGYACSEADRYALAFDVPRPFVIHHGGLVHVYYRNVESFDINKILYETDVIGSFYRGMTFLNDRYREELFVKVEAEDAADALVKEAGR